MLTYAHACSRMLTHAHVCGRMADELLGEFLPQHNALAPLQHRGFHRDSMLKLVGAAHTHTMSGEVHDVCHL